MVLLLDPRAIPARLFDPTALVNVDIIRDAVRSLLGVPVEALRWLGVVSLFSEVQIAASDDNSDLVLLASFAGVAIQDVRAWNTKAITAQVLSDRGDGVFVTPALLAVLLAREIVRDRKHDLAAWLRGLPPRLQESFASQLGQLRYSEEGHALARELIGVDGPFGDLLQSASRGRGRHSWRWGRSRGMKRSNAWRFGFATSMEQPRN